MNKDAVFDADGGLSGYPGRGWGWTDDWAFFKGRGWKRRPLLDPKEETTLRMLLGEGWGSGKGGGPLGNRAQGLTKAHDLPEEDPKRPTEMRRMH